MKSLVRRPLGVLAAVVSAGAGLGLTPAASAVSNPPSQPAARTAAVAGQNGPNFRFHNGINQPRSAWTQAAGLPFSFTYEVSTVLDSRYFLPTPDGRACVALRTTGWSNPADVGAQYTVEMWDTDWTDERVGPVVAYYATDTVQSYCWTGLAADHEHYFRIVKPFGPSTISGDGSVGF